MSDLLPPNATPQERALARTVNSHISRIPTPMRELWNPETCPVHVLPWLAWSLSVESWDPNWPAHIKRGVIKSAIETARRKGTKGAVIDAVSALGARAEIVEWWEKSPAGTPHTFEVNIVATDTSTAMQDMLLAEINRTKPLRSHFSINFGSALTGSVNIVGVLRPASFVRLDAVADAAITVENYFDPSGAPYSDPSGNPYQFLSL